jgi:cytochrome c
MAMRGSNELLFTTWEGDLFSISLDAIAPEGPPAFRHLAQGLSEPMGLAISGERIFVTEKNEVTELIDDDGDGHFETYRCLSHAWPCTLDYHEYLFGAVVKDSHIYFSSSVAMGIRGTHNRQAPLRGSVIKVHIDTGETEFVAGGLRSPDGIGVGPEDSILITDNQGEWLPGNKLIHLAQDAFYQFRSRPPWHPLDRPEPTPPAIWLPQGEIAASPTQPIMVPDNWGPYAGQVIFGDATFGGLQRAFLEEVEGTMQGVVFPFSQGFRHLFHRFEFDPNGTLYAGGIARGSDWEFIERVSGLTQIRFNGRDVFEPLAVRIHSNGLELEFTQPLGDGIGWDPDGYFVTQWGYQGTQTYGGAKIRHRRSKVRSASVSSDRRRVFLEIDGMVEGEVIYVRLPLSLSSSGSESLWAGEMWYTVNRIPQNNQGNVRRPPAGYRSSSTPYFQFSSGDQGRFLYRTYCAACHSLDGTRLAGPTFAGLAGGRRQVRQEPTGPLEEVTADHEYIRRSILEPNAQLVENYQANLMPPIGGMLSESQLGQLVDYLVRTSNPEEARKELAIEPRRVREWKMSDFGELSHRVTTNKPDQGAIHRGLQSFLKAQCVQCHRLSNYGIELGPDLSESIQRYQGKKLLQQIIEPSSEIHPKFHQNVLLLSSGQVVTGMVIEETAETYQLVANLLESSNRLIVRKDAVERQQPAKVSAMPEGTLNTLTKTEIIDLLLFLESSPKRPFLSEPQKVEK